MKRLAVALAFMMSAGCAGIPIGTMWRLSQFAPEDVARLDPAILGVAVDLPDVLSLNPDETSLDIELFHGGGADKERVLAESATLVTVESGRHVVTPLRAADEGRHWHVMRLSQEAQKSFRRFQAAFREVLAAEGPRSFNLTVNPRFKDEKNLAGTHDVTIALRLEGEDGWFVLLEDAEMDFDELRRADTDSQQ